MQSDLELVTVFLLTHLHITLSFYIYYKWSRQQETLRVSFFLILKLSSHLFEGGLFFISLSLVCHDNSSVRVHKYNSLFKLRKLALNKIKM